jgi:hypothetical protein
LSGCDDDAQFSKSPFGTKLVWAFEKKESNKNNKSSFVFIDLVYDSVVQVYK